MNTSEVMPFITPFLEGDIEKTCRTLSSETVLIPQFFDFVEKRQDWVSRHPLQTNRVLRNIALSQCETTTLEKVAKLRASLSTPPTVKDLHKAINDGSFEEARNIIKNCSKEGLPALLSTVDLRGYNAFELALKRREAFFDELLIYAPEHEWLFQKGTMLLHAAADKATKVQRVLNLCPENLRTNLFRAKDTVTRVSALDRALFWDSPGVIAFLIAECPSDDLGAFLAQDAYGYTPLHKAALSGQKKLKTVLEAIPGSYLPSLYVPNNRGHTPMDLADHSLEMQAMLFRYAPASCRASCFERSEEKSSLFEAFLKKAAEGNACIKEALEGFVFDPEAKLSRHIQPSQQNGPLTHLPFGMKGHIYRTNSPHPEKLTQRVEAMEAADVDTVVLLQQQQEYMSNGVDLKVFYEEQQFQVCHFPIQDFNIPEQGIFVHLVDRLYEQALLGHNIVIHCYGGIGRTGLVLALLANRVFGYDGKQAIQWVRQFVSGAVETQPQIKFVETACKQPYTPR